MVNYSEIYNDFYYQKRLTSYRQESYDDLSAIILNILNFNTFIDLGCATGELVYRLNDNGKNGLGVEISTAVLKLLPNADQRNIYIYDITELSIPKKFGKFDLTICLEVAEHIPTERSLNLIQNISHLSNKVIFSAATPGQGGTGHINEQYWDYWENLFHICNFKVDFKINNLFKMALKNSRAMSYYKDNIQFLKKIKNGEY